MLISEQARAELDLYLGENPRLGDVPLFPAPRNPNAPMRRDTASSWLVKAEAGAELPKMRGGTFHPYRRLWAQERQHLSDTDVAAAGGWKNTASLKASYQDAKSATVLSVVQNA